MRENPTFELEPIREFKTSLEGVQEIIAELEQVIKEREEREKRVKRKAVKRRG